MKLTRSSLKKPQTEFEARKNEESISLPLFPCLRKTRDQERKYIYIYKMGGRFENARDIPPMFPSPSLLARIFGTGVHPPFGRVQGKRVRRLCPPRHGRASAVAVGVVEPQSENRDASSARCSRARTRAREHDTRFIHARSYGTERRVRFFFPHCSFILLVGRTFVT